MNMTIVEIEPLENGAHNNQTAHNLILPVPEGYAWIPEALQPCENFPFGQVEVAEGIGPDGQTCMVVTKWTPGEIPVAPEPEPIPEPEPSEFEKMQAQVLYTAAMTDTLLPSEEE